MIDPYSKITTIKLWTDEYISKNMLEAHINPNTDAASRKASTIRKTVDFIKTVLPINKSICDYGCGPGLYSNLLQREGYQVTGVDISDNSLIYAKKQNCDIDYYNMNYVSEVLPKKVDLALMIYCDFGALDPNSQVKTLSNIHKALNDNGLFFFDVMSIGYFEKQEERLEVSKETDGFYMAGECTITSNFIKYPDLKLLLAHHKTQGYKGVDYYNWDKCYDVDEMKTLLEDNRFEIINVYSNTYGELNFEKNETLSFLCRKR